MLYEINLSSGCKGEEVEKPAQGPRLADTIELRSTILSIPPPTHPSLPTTLKTFGDGQLLKVLHTIYFAKTTWIGKARVGLEVPPDLSTHPAWQIMVGPAASQCDTRAAGRTEPK